MSKPLRGRYEVTKRRVEERKTATGGSTTVYNEPDGYLECEFVLEIDEERLLRLMGRKAAFSSRGVSVLGGGAVKLKVTKKARIPKA